MERAIAVIVRRFDVILPLDELHVALAQEHLLHAVNVVDVAAHHADAGNVVDVFLGGLHRDLQPLAPQLLDDAAGGLQAAFDVVDGVVVVADAELLVQHLQPRLDLAHGRAVEMFKLQKILIAAIELCGLIPQHDVRADGDKGLVHGGLPERLISFSQYTTSACARKGKFAGKRTGQTDGKRIYYKL